MRLKPPFIFYIQLMPCKKNTHLCSFLHIKKELRLTDLKITVKTYLPYASLTMPIHKTIKRLRLSNNFTQQAIAKKLNISQNAYSLMENGKTKIDEHRIIELAELFKVSLSDLLADTTINIEEAFNANENLSNVVAMADNNIVELLKLLKEQLKIKDKQIEQLIFQLEQATCLLNLYLKTASK